MIVYENNQIKLITYIIVSYTYYSIENMIRDEKLIEKKKNM